MIEVHKTEKFARYVHPRDVYDPPPGKLMYAGALIKKPVGSIVAPQETKKKSKVRDSEGSVSCGSSDDDDNIIIIKPGTLRTLTFENDSDISNSDEDAFPINN